MNEARHGRVRAAAPYLAAALAGILLSYLLVTEWAFPIEREAPGTEVPSVVGIVFDSAAKKLELAGFTAERGEARSGVRQSPGTVLEQNPAAGTIQKAGTKILLHVSGSGK